MFVAYIYPHKYHSENRKVEPLFDNKFVLNLITKRMSDEEVDALKNGVWLLETERELKDRNKNPFRICKPTLFLGEPQEVLGQPYIHEALAFAFDENPETTSRRFGKKTKELLGRRIAYHTGQDLSGIWGWVRNQVVAGTTSLKELGQWVSTPVPVDWDKAKLLPATINLRSGGVDSVYYFRDLNSDEDDTLRIRAYNLDDYRSIIPDYVKISKIGLHQMTIEVLLNKMLAIVYKVDPMYPDVLAEFQQTGAFWLTVTPYVDRPDGTFDVGIEKTSVNFPAMLKKYGIEEINGQYVPKDTPDWTLKKIEGYRPEGNVCEVTSPTTCTVCVSFANGMSGRYPLIYMMKRYPGKCLNAQFAAKGYSLDSMRVMVTLLGKE